MIVHNILEAIADHPFVSIGLALVYLLGRALSLIAQAISRWPE
jgi:hypothetical protein